MSGGAGHPGVRAMSGRRPFLTELDSRAAVKGSTEADRVAPCEIRLAARIASRSTLSRLDASELSSWLRNRTLQLIGFHLDRSGRRLGSPTVPGAALTASEFLTYLHHLARECDRLEALLTGSDEE
jgi:hypothetical protein